MVPGQPSLRSALLDPELPVPEGLTDPAGNPAGKRFAVYRNNVAMSLTEALRTGFPVLRKLLGDPGFDRLAGQFLRAHPPQSPLMMFYGAEMPAFLETFAPLSHLGYLADTARLELALRASYHAADATPLDPVRLAGIAPERLLASGIALAPSARLIRSPWPIHDIWRYNTEESAPKPEARAQDVLVLRPEFDPEPYALTKASGAWLATAMDGKPIGAAQDAAIAEDPEFDLQPLLSLLLSKNAIIDIIPAGKDVP